MGGHHQPNGIVLHVGGDDDPPCQPLGARDRGGVHDRLHQRLEIAGRAADDLVHLAAVGIGDDDLEEEPIELRFGKRICPLLLNGVLRRQNEEGTVQLVGRARYRDSPLLHRLQERRLALGAGAIDLVGKHELTEDRSRSEPKRPLSAARTLDDDGRARDVRRHEVGRELDAGIGKVECPGKGPHQQRLAQTGHALQQHVPIGEDRDERVDDDPVLADDRLLDLGAETRKDFAKAFTDPFDRGHIVKRQLQLRRAGHLSHRDCPGAGPMTDRALDAWRPGDARCNLPAPRSLPAPRAPGAWDPGSRPGASARSRGP